MIACVFSRMPSSVIRSFAYSATDGELDVRFLTGRRYIYHGVPPEVADQLEGASSKGSYFNDHIRDRFRFTRDR